ncbi:MAG: RsmB/NOP family class I SAM-dependent RNA methyltransferase [Christensenellales bacterium]
MNAQHPLPAAFISDMRRMLGAEADAFLAALEGESARALRLNPARAGAAEAAAQSTDGRVPWARGGRYLARGARPGASIAHFAGAFYLQEASAMMPAAVLAAKPGERVLDLCAAPGGKATQIAADLAGEGVLIANEIDKTRARALYQNIERMGVINAAVVNERPDRLAARWAGYFDAVLVDAPCSGEGMFRREPDARAAWQPGAPAGCARRQAAILADAATLVAPGGRLVYATCTFNELENEGAARAFLAAHPEFSAEEFTLDGLGASKGGMLRIHPHQARGDGQFAALFRRADAGARAAFPDPTDATAQTAASDFARAFGAFPADMLPVVQGEMLYAIPRGAPPMDGLRAISPGLALAHLRKGRFDPAHAYAMAGTNLPAVELDGAQARAYLRGEAVVSQGAGWLVATHGGMPLGWGKATGGLLKNHLPKGLRRN